MIQTKRLIIRPFEEKDLDAFISYRNDAVWMRYQGFKCLDRQAYADFLLAESSLTEGKQMAIASKETGALLGDLYVKREEDSLWIGYTIHPDQARKGFAFEAANAVCVWADEQGLRVKAGVMPENTASIGLLEKLGFIQCGVDEEGELLYERSMITQEGDQQR